MQNFETIEIVGACKEESSDESTIISSQTSTLTRDQGKSVLKISIYLLTITFKIKKINLACNFFTGQDGIPSAIAEELAEKLKLTADDDDQSAEASVDNEDDDDESSTTEDRGNYYNFY